MPQRFTDGELEAFAIDPRQPSAWAVCPFCGQDLVLGCRRGTGNISLAHAAMPDPLRKGQFVPGCEPFQKIATANAVEFLRLCKAQGVNWQKLVG